MRNRSLVVLAALLAALIVLAEVLPRAVWLGARTVAVGNITLDSGLRYVAPLNDPSLDDDVEKSGASLIIFSHLPGHKLHRLDPWFGRLMAFDWLVSLFDARNPGIQHSSATVLGPGETLHVDIEQKGRGRYSVYKGHVLFSLPDGQTIANVNRIELKVPYSRRLAVDAPQAAAWMRQIATLVAAIIVLILIIPATILRNVAPGIVGTVALAIVVAGAAEIYLRETGKFTKRDLLWPATFVPGAGLQFKPHSTVRYTDGFQFWITENTNSLGFLDREPAIPKPPDTFRILFVGDSIVEAMQVSLKEKFQTRLIDLLRKEYPSKKLDIVAVSRSGLGQGSQLGLYLAHRDLKPDLVVLMFVGNDFANNSVLLEAIRTGFDPRYPLWMFPIIDDDGKCGTIAPDASWGKHLLSQDLSVRMAQLRTISSLYPARLDSLLPEHMDSVFYKPSPLPLIYSEAIALTKCSLAHWKQVADEDHFKLLVVATDTVTIGRAGNGQIVHLRNVTSELGMALFDMYPALERYGDINSAKIPFDGHWNAKGHRWAADAMFDYLKASKSIP